MREFLDGFFLATVVTVAFIVIIAIFGGSN